MASPKQREVLDMMQEGMSFSKAYRKAGLSEYGHNEAEFLMRLLLNGMITVSVNDTKE